MDFVNGSFKILIMRFVLSFIWVSVISLRFENTDMALHYGTMFRECIRHQIVAK
jgi:hypothetical protein